MNSRPNPLNTSRRGYVSMMLVISSSLVALALLSAAFKATLQARDGQKVVQVRVDVAQRESAVLRAILALTPNHAIGAMQDNASLAPGSYAWRKVFEDALVLANASDADADAFGASLGAARVSNAANFTGDVATIFSAASGGGLITSGVNQQPGASFPPYLTASADVAALDALYPIVAEEKIYGANAAGTAELSTDTYPVYNRIPYPNIRFGYAEPGDRFVAKRNWWAFSIRYPSNVPGVPALRKQYVLSLYEIPTQVALSSTAWMSLGEHSDGSAWNGVQIQGSVYGERILAEKTMALNRVSSRSGIDVGAAGGTLSLNVGGATVGSGFDSDDTSLAFEAQQDRFFPVSVASGSGRVAFVPLNRGLQFYRFVGTQADQNTLSPTSWNNYSIGARRCAIKVRVTKASAFTDQTPQAINVTYKAGGADVSVDLERGVNWPREDEAGGPLMPFQSDTTQAGGRRALLLHLGRLKAWLDSLGGDGLDINNSIAVNPDPADASIRSPSFPSHSLDLSLVLRNGIDLTGFTKGLSIVTDMRLYFGDDLNAVATTAPAGSGLSGTFYPPLSIFAPEKRWGTTAEQRIVKLRGQVGSLDAGLGTMLRPMDMRSGQDDALATNLDASLSEITSPAQLPPVNFMNWMLTIEEVDATSGGLAGN